MFLYCKTNETERFIDFVEMIINICRRYKTINNRIIFQIDDELLKFYSDSLKNNYNISVMFNSDKDRAMYFKCLLDRYVGNINEQEKLNGITCNSNNEKYIYVALSNSFALLSCGSVDSTYEIGMVKKSICNFSVDTYSSLQDNYLIFNPNSEKHHRNSCGKASKVHFSNDEYQKILYTSKTEYQIYNCNSKKIENKRRWNVYNNMLVVFANTQDGEYHSYDPDETDTREPYERARKYFGLK